MPCIVLRSVHGGDRYAFNIDQYDIDIPTKQADEDPVWEELHELAEEWAVASCAFDYGDEYTIGVTTERDAGVARMADAEVLWCGGYYEMPSQEEDEEDE